MARVDGRRHGYDEHFTALGAGGVGSEPEPAGAGQFRGICFPCGVDALDKLGNAASVEVEARVSNRLPNSTASGRPT